MKDKRQMALEHDKKWNDYLKKLGVLPIIYTPIASPNLRLRINK